MAKILTLSPSDNLTVLDADKPRLADAYQGGDGTLVAGACLLEAARRAGLKEVPCLVEDLSDAEALIKALAKVFGWRVRASPGRRPGPDVVIEYVVRSGREEVRAVMFVESEVGHDQGGAEEYLRSLCKRLRPLVEEYGEGVRFNVVVLTNAPRRLTERLRDAGKREGLERELGFGLIEGVNFFVAPVLIAREVLPAVFVRAMGAAALWA